jgi:chromosome partitioning protein
VTDAGDDVAARGRAIFQRLRGQDTPPAAPEPVDPEPVPANGTYAIDEEPEPEAAAAADTPAEAEAIDEDDLPPLVSAATDDEDQVFAELVAVAEAEGVVAAPPLPPRVTTPERGPLPGLADLPTLAEDDGQSDPIYHPGEDDQEVVGVKAAPQSFARPLPRIMAVANQKGGVGKTTTAVNLGACLADLGYRVLIVDLDPQGNASTGVGVNIRDLQGSMYDVILHDLPIEDCVEATSVRNLFCAPSSLDLAGAEIELVPAFSRELRLKRALDEVRDDYDFMLIDCPPSLGLLTVNALAAATEVVVPIQCEYYALEGLGQLLRNVNLVQKNLNTALEVSAIILVMYDARTKLADQVVTEVREHFGDKVCRHVVPRTVRLSEAPSFGQPIIAFDSSSRGAIAYKELAKEVSGGTPQRAR